MQQKKSSNTPLLVVLGFITILYFLLTSPGESLVSLIPYASVIVTGYDQGKRVRFRQTPKEFRHTILLLGLLTVIIALFYLLTAKVPSPFVLIYYLLLPFVSTLIGFAEKSSERG